jgi:hypothetical protein
MSLSSLTSEASQLLDFYRGEKNAINAALSAAIAALPSKGTVWYHIDSISGNDAAAGSAAAPWRTLAPLAAQVTERPGVAVVARMARGGTYVFPEITAKHCYLVLDGQAFDPRATGEPQANLVLDYRIAGGAIFAASAIYAQNVAAEMRYLKIIGATRSAEHAATPLTTQQYGLVTGLGSNALILNDVDVELNDIPMLDGLLGTLALRAVRFERGVGNVPMSSRIGRHAINLMLESLTYPDGESFHDVLEFEGYESNKPLGVVSNINITDTLP